tara:strand:- start:2549 stop:3286 length:738 start_codon:yes stop_codon:yes gene_type:complete
LWRGGRYAPLKTLKQNNMPVFGNYQDMPTLPTRSLGCNNVEFLMISPTSTGNSNLNLYSQVTMQGSALLESINSDYLNGSLSVTECVTALESYKSYLTQAITHLGAGSGEGTDALGWSGYYWYLAEQTSWFFGVSTQNSCNENRGNLTQTHADINVVRSNYWGQIANVQGEIEMYQSVLDMSVEEAELDSNIAYWENLAQQLDEANEKSQTDVKNLKFANAIEMISIGGAILILLYTGYKTLKKG